MRKRELIDRTLLDIPSDDNKWEELVKFADDVACANEITEQEIVKPYLDKLKEKVEENSMIDYAEDLYDGGQLVINYFGLCHIIDNLLSEQGE